jgi:hypothetical protein
MDHEHRHVHDVHHAARMIRSVKPTVIHIGIHRCAIGIPTTRICITGTDMSNKQGKRPSMRF